MGLASIRFSLLCSIQRLKPTARCQLSLNREVEQTKNDNQILSGRSEASSHLLMSSSWAELQLYRLVNQAFESKAQVSGLK